MAPVLCIVVRLLQTTEVSEGPRNLIAIALHVCLMVGSGTYNSGNVSCHTGFLGYANNL